MSAKTKAHEIQWRRSKELDMLARGLSQAEMSRELQVSEACISLDMQYLREQAKESMKDYVTEHFPQRYHTCIHAFNIVIKNAYDIAQDSDDNRQKLQAWQLYKDTHMELTELSANAATVDSALRYIRGKQAQQQKANDSSDEDEHDIITTTATTTATGRQSVF